MAVEVIRRESVRLLVDLGEENVRYSFIYLAWIGASLPCATGVISVIEMWIFN